MTSHRTLHLAVTGGTGGHTYPALTTVTTLRDRLAQQGTTLNVTWYGDAHGLEARICRAHGSTPAAVYSTVQRARARLDRLEPAMDEIAEPSEQEQRDLLDRYADAFERADIPALTRLLTEDTVWQMPPNPSWFAGRDSAVRLLTARLRSHGSRLVPLWANGQPGFAMYQDGEAFSVQVLTLRGPAIAAVTAFHDADLVRRFGLPARI